jgi:hypothetical protein
MRPNVFRILWLGTRNLGGFALGLLEDGSVKWKGPFFANFSGLSTVCYIVHGDSHLCFYFCRPGKRT